MTFLTPEQVSFFHENGYLVIEDFLSKSTISGLKDEIQSIIAAADLTKVQSIFTTDDQHRRTDDYFLESGSNISFFWEKKAMEKAAAKSLYDSADAKKEESGDASPSFTPDGRPLTLEAGLPGSLGLNKIGHNLHDLSSPFKEVSYDARVGSMCQELGLVDPLLVQSMYIFKQPYIGKLSLSSSLSLLDLSCSYSYSFSTTILSSFSNLFVLR